MPKTIQIRDLDDAVYAGLSRRAAEEGITVPELLRRHATKLATQPSMRSWYEHVRRVPPSAIPSDEVIEALDELRGPWPDARR